MVTNMTIDGEVCLDDEETRIGGRITDLTSHVSKHPEIGCKTPEECTAYCQSHPEAKGQCQEFKQGQKQGQRYQSNQPGSFGDPNEGRDFNPGSGQGGYGPGSDGANQFGQPGPYGQMPLQGIQSPQGQQPPNFQQPPMQQPYQPNQPPQPDQSSQPSSFIKKFLGNAVDIFTR